MENIPGNMEEKVNDRFKEERKSRWQILFVDDHGNMITLKWFKPMSIAVLCALIFSVASCITFAVLFHSTQKDNRDYTSKIDAYKQQINSIQTEKDILMAKLVIAESKLNGDRLSGMENGADTQSSDGKEIKPDENEHIPDNRQVNTPKKNASDNDTAAGDSPDDNKPDSDIINGVDVDKLVFSHEPKIDLLRTTFIVKNAGDTSEAISGYIFIIFKADETAPKDWFALPSVGLAGGKPAFPKRGQYFKIHRFKTVHFKAGRQKNPESYKKATIYVFGEDETLLLKKTVPVTFETS